MCQIVSQVWLRKEGCARSYPGNCDYEGCQPNPVEWCRQAKNQGTSGLLECQNTQSSVAVWAITAGNGELQNETSMHEWGTFFPTPSLICRSSFCGSLMSSKNMSESVGFVFLEMVRDMQFLGIKNLYHLHIRICYKIIFNQFKHRDQWNIIPYGDCNKEAQYCTTNAVFHIKLGMFENGLGTPNCSARLECPNYALEIFQSILHLLQKV